MTILYKLAVTQYNLIYISKPDMQGLQNQYYYV